MQFIPTLSLTARTGAQASWIESPAGQLNWQLGAALAIPIYEGGAMWARMRQQSAEENQARFQLDYAHLSARRDLDNALNNEEAVKAQIAAAEERVKAAQQAAREATARYEVGLIPYTPVLNALNAAYAAELSLVQLQLARVTTRVALLDAAGQGVQP
jgi:outer membrane protein